MKQETRDRREDGQRTGLANEKEEPDTAGEVEHQRHGVARVAQQIDDGEEGAVEGAPEPTRLDGRAGEDGVGGRLVRAGGAADEGRGEAPGEADEDEAEDVVDGGGALLVFLCCVV